MDNQTFLTHVRMGTQDDDFFFAKLEGAYPQAFYPNKKLDRTQFRGYTFALVICRHPVTKKYLSVNENNHKGWWIPGGGVQAGETFREAAVRETKEEAGVDVELKGLLKVEYGTSYDSFRMRVIFYAEPVDVHQCEPKSEADKESAGAEWLTIDEFKEKEKIRGNELLEFSSRLEEGRLYPLDLLDEND
jgi:ADP-ribose pyrophosphatase YjhB (NUDIX family)